MKKINKTILFPIIMILLFSCDDVLEKDITSDLLVITAPLEGMTISGNIVDFSWQGIDGADNYRLQVINNNQGIILDSLVSQLSSSHIMSPGNYKWRVKGINFAYETDYSFPVNFELEASEDLSSQRIVLQTPSDNFYSNNPNFTFTWDGISTADSYSIDIIRDNGATQTVLQENNITGLSYSADPLIFDEDSKYLWKVKGVNSLSETGFSGRILFLDRVAPSQPILVSPIDNQMETSTMVNFNWRNETDTGGLQTEITNTLEISSDINFNSILNSSNTTGNTDQYTFMGSGTYYWRVRAIDLASNESNYSVINSLEIQ